MPDPITEAPLAPGEFVHLLIRDGASAKTGDESVSFGRTNGSLCYFNRGQPYEIERSHKVELFEQDGRKQEFLSSIERLDLTLKQLRDGFNDHVVRKIHFVELKDLLEGIAREHIHQRGYLTQGIVLLVDAVAYTKAENLSKRGLKALTSVVDICKRFELEREDVRMCGRILRRSGFDTFPPV